MKIKQTIAVLAGLLVAVNGFAQGKCTFGNTPTRAVIYSLTGTAVTAGVAKAGLYWSGDLQAVPNLAAPTDSFALAVQAIGTATIAAGANAVIPVATSLAGVYSGGIVAITGTTSTETPSVLLQVRAWSAQYNTYEEAFNARAFVGASQVMTIKLGFGNDPSTPISGVVNSFTITPVPEPSTVLLGLLGGLGAMVLLRRRS